MDRYEELKNTGFWKEINVIGKCKNCGENVYDVSFVRGEEGLFCGIDCLFEFRRKE